MHDLECSFLDGSVCELKSEQKTDAIRELVEKASVFHKINNTQHLVQEVLDRERKQTTGFGHGVAVAHAQYDGLDSVIMALGKSRKGIEYESMDRKPVYLLFLIASPPDLQNDYLRALSILVKLVRQEEFRSAIYQAGNIAEIERRLHTHFCSLLSLEKTKSV